MGPDLGLAGQSRLFDGIGPDELASLLRCLSATTRHYAKGRFVLRAGDVTTQVGEVISGRVHVVKEDFWGNRTILSELEVGGLFGETYAAMPSEPLEVSVIAAERSEVLFLDVRRILTTCSSACAFHTRLIRNLLDVSAQKNLMLTRKLECMAQRTTREKLLSYLSAESQRQGSSSFEIPFDRQQLADYLCVDRSAMSSELGRLRDEGTLRFERSKFTLTGTDLTKRHQRLE